MNDVPRRELVRERLLYIPGALLDTQLLFLDLRSETDVHILFRCLGDQESTEWKPEKAQFWSLVAFSFALVPF